MQSVGVFGLFLILLSWSACRAQTCTFNYSPEVRFTHHFSFDHLNNVKEPHNTFGSPPNNVVHICSNAYRTRLSNISIDFDSNANFAKSAKTAGRHGNRRTQCPKWICSCNIHVSYPFGITSTGRGYCYGTSVTMSLTNK